jgi:hypothetical protein
LARVRSLELTDPTIDLLRAHRVLHAEQVLANATASPYDDVIFCDASTELLRGRKVTTLQLNALLRRAGRPSDLLLVTAVGSRPAVWCK